MVPGCARVGVEYTFNASEKRPDPKDLVGSSKASKRKKEGSRGAKRTLDNVRDMSHWGREATTEREP